MAGFVTETECSTDVPSMAACSSASTADVPAFATVYDKERRCAADAGVQAGADSLEQERRRADAGGDDAPVAAAPQEVATPPITAEAKGPLQLSAAMAALQGTWHGDILGRLKVQGDMVTYETNTSIKIRILEEPGEVILDGWRTEATLLHNECVCWRFPARGDHEQEKYLYWTRVRPGAPRYVDLSAPYVAPAPRPRAAPRRAVRNTQEAIPPEPVLAVLQGRWDVAEVGGSVTVAGAVAKFSFHAAGSSMRFRCLPDGVVALEDWHAKVDVNTEEPLTRISWSLKTPGKEDSQGVTWVRPPGETAPPLPVPAVSVAAAAGASQSSSARGGVRRGREALPPRPAPVLRPRRSRTEAPSPEKPKRPASASKARPAAPKAKRQRTSKPAPAVHSGASASALAAASAAAAAAPMELEPLSKEARLELQKKLDLLDDDRLDKVMDFLKPELGDTGDEEAELDINKLAPARQHELLNFVLGQLEEAHSAAMQRIKAAHADEAAARHKPPAASPQAEAAVATSVSASAGDVTEAQVAAELAQQEALPVSDADLFGTDRAESMLDFADEVLSMLDPTGQFT
eukprot:TRINITY_DN13596_c0_g2_i1.p1 TRINITY_DN13596_c0_g2~~TRINITY_DN13596_c0_g2_i1.p1  ORF type:complete len:603 (+),score=122.10 TRINITY_DN13596_c0_g2_i1:85-1809(+)